MVKTIHTARFFKKVGSKKMIDKVIDVILNTTPLLTDAFTVSQYRNLIAFEKLDPTIEPQFTPFAPRLPYSFCARCRNLGLLYCFERKALLNMPLVVMKKLLMFSTS